MSMTDTDLCIAAMGWTQESVTPVVWWAPIPVSAKYPDGGSRCIGPISTETPDFAHNIEWAMKLARATELKYGCLLTLCSYFLQGGAKGRVYDMVFRFPSGPKDTILGRATSEPEAAIRAAVVNVCEAHAAVKPKGSSNGVDD